jgi:serine protease
MKRSHFILFLTLLTCLSFFLQRTPVFPRKPNREIKVKIVKNKQKSLPPRLLVKFKKGTSETEKRKIILKSKGLKGIHKFLKDRVFILEMDSTESMKENLKMLKSNPDIIYVEPDYQIKAFYTPNDPYFSYQWHFHQIQLENAWEIENGGNSNIKVAVIDTGIAYEDYDSFTQAPDLAGTTFSQGYDFVNDDTHPNDDNGHGTHVAGTIAQTTNNGLGVAGVAYKTSLMPVKVLDIDGYGYTSWVAEGIYYAVDNGAKVINLSLGSTEYSQTLYEAVEYAFQKGVIIVASAGNDSTSTLSYPAAFPEVISVGAVRYDKTLAYYSNYGEGLDIVAPGGDINVDQNSDGYADGVLQQTFHPPGATSNFAYYFFQGTSMAAPHVSGVAALLLAHGENASEVRNIINSTADDLGETGYDEVYGYGLLNASKALDRISPSAPLMLNPTLLNNINFAFEWTTSSDNEKINFYKVYRNISPSVENFTLLSTTTSNSFSSSFEGESSIWFKVKAVDYGGNESPLSLPLHITVTKALISTEGGSVNIDDKVVITFPAGALSQPTTVNVSTKVNPSFPTELYAGGTIYTLSPTITFLKEVTLTFPYFKEDAERKAAIYCFNPERNEWEYLGGLVDKANKLVEVKIKHFSLYGVLWGNALQGPHGNYTSSTNKCYACHDVHEAQGSFRLLPANTVYDTCQYCHNGSGAENIVYGEIYGIPPAQGFGHRQNQGIFSIPGGNQPISTPTVDNGLTCSSCHTPHGNATRIITQTYYCDSTITASDHLLLRDPGPKSGSVVFYGASWCADCHDRRHSENPLLFNHPVSPTLSYQEASLARDNSSFQMDPVNPANPRTNPICEHCHEDKRDVETTFSSPQEPPTTTNPRYNNFPHEGENRYLLVESGDDLCLNCHPPQSLP